MSWLTPQFSTLPVHSPLPLQVRLPACKRPRQVHLVRRAFRLVPARYRPVVCLWTSFAEPLRQSPLQPLRWASAAWSHSIYCMALVSTSSVTALLTNSALWPPVAWWAPLVRLRRVRLRPGGPLPVRTLQYPTGIPSPSANQQAEIDLSSALHSRTRTFLACVASRGGFILLENPSSSLL